MLPPYYAEPQFRLIEGGEDAPCLRELMPVSWDCESVRRLKRETALRGNHPTTLCLGRLETDAFLRYLKTIPGASSLKEVDGIIYEGLQIRVIPEIESTLRVLEVVEPEEKASLFPPRNPSPPYAA